MEPQMNSSSDTIVAIATAPGTGGIAVIRLSGPDAIGIFSKVWRGADPSAMKSHTAHLGRIMSPDGSILDEVVATLFRGPNSFTGEDVVEISCHGSRWIQREIVKLLIANGARGANPGEFSQRAFINGRIDLAQAEGIADLVAASSRAAHRLAIQQANGTFSSRLDSLRDKLIDLASLLELELDFSEEDVEFADRRQLREITDSAIAATGRLADSYAAGRAFKEGIPVVIAGEPNVGKSTLLNRLLEEEKAIVTDVPGTTRDIIEGTCEIDGTLFRFVDTAGLRVTDDTVERLGIERATERLHNAAVVLWTVDATQPIEPQLNLLRSHTEQLGEIPVLLLLNKSDLAIGDIELSESKLDFSGNQPPFSSAPSNNSNSSNNSNNTNLSNNSDYSNPSNFAQTINLSASTGEGIDLLKQWLKDYAARLRGNENDIIVTNARHHAAIVSGKESLERVRTALDAGTSADFIAQDVRETIHDLSAITGQISTPTLLSTIFSRFCIGK